MPPLELLVVAEPPPVDDAPCEEQPISAHAPSAASRAESRASISGTPGDAGQLLDGGGEVDLRLVELDRDRERPHVRLVGRARLTPDDAPDREPHLVRSSEDVEVELDPRADVELLPGEEQGADGAEITNERELEIGGVAHLSGLDVERVAGEVPEIPAPIPGVVRVSALHRLTIAEVGARRTTRSPGGGSASATLMAMGVVGTLLDWLRGEPEPVIVREDRPEDPALPRDPYRSGARRVGGSLTPSRLERFAGYGVLRTFDGDDLDYARHLLEAPDGERLALSCFDVDDAAADPFFRLRFDEARVLLRLRHPSLARVIELGREGDVCWHLAAYPHGLTLAELDTPVGPPAMRARLRLLLAAFADAAEGLDSAHTDPDDAGFPLGCYYRCLTPSALLLGVDGRCSVVDWGVHDLLAAHRRSSGLEGAAGVYEWRSSALALLRYLAPEQALGRAVNRRADVFALGVMLYELSTGTHPFSGQGVLETLERIAHAEAPPPAGRVEGYPDDVASLLARALAKDPAERPTAGEFARHLRDALAGSESDERARAERRHERDE